MADPRDISAMEEREREHYRLLRRKRKADDEVNRSQALLKKRLAAINKSTDIQYTPEEPFFERLGRMDRDADKKKIERQRQIQSKRA